MVKKREESEERGRDVEKNVWMMRASLAPSSISSSVFFLVEKRERKSRRIFLLRPPATSWCGVPDEHCILIPSEMFRLCIIVLERVLGLLPGHNPDGSSFAQPRLAPRLRLVSTTRRRKKATLCFKLKRSRRRRWREDDVDGFEHFA